MKTSSQLCPWIDHDKWWDERMRAGASIEQLREQWRNMNTVVSLTDGGERQVPFAAGVAINRIVAVCRRESIPCDVQPFDWPLPGDNVILHSWGVGFEVVTSQDSLDELNRAELAALSQLNRYSMPLIVDAIPSEFSQPAEA